jgi:hypothetical protein
MTATTSKPVYGASMEGCWFDCVRGIYIGEAIIMEAIAHGFDCKEELSALAGSQIRLTDYDYYHELTDAAEEFMQKFAAEGYWFGFSEGGDWGLWASEQDDY